jgi:hypothetical protein
MVELLSVADASRRGQAMLAVNTGDQATGVRAK